MNDLLLAGGIDAVHIDRPFLHDIKAVGRIAFVEQIRALVQHFEERERSDVGQIGRRQPGKKLATPQGVDNGDLLKLGK